MDTSNINNFKIKLRFVGKRKDKYLGTKICLKGNEDEKDRHYEFHKYNEKLDSYSIRNCVNYVDHSGGNVWTSKEIESNIKSKAWTVIK